MNTIKTIAVTFIHGQILSNNEIDRIRYCLENYDLALVFIGSTNKAPSPTNPFGYPLRRQMVTSVFPDTQNLGINPIPDMIHLDYEWAKMAFSEIIRLTGTTCVSDISVVCDEPRESLYRSMFPQFKIESFSLALGGVNGYGLRESFFNGNLFSGSGGFINSQVCKVVLNELSRIPGFFESLRVEWERESKRRDPKEVTVVFCGGCVAVGMIDAGFDPHTYTLPTMLHDKKSKDIVGAIKVIADETTINVIDPVSTVSDPYNQLLVTVITTIIVEPNVDGSLPDIKGRRGIKRVAWQPLTTVHRLAGVMAGEHAGIIELIRRKHYANY